MGVALFERRIHESPDDCCRIPCTRPFRLPPRPERRGRLQRLEEPVVRRERQQLFPEQPEQPERRRERQQQRQLEQHAEEPERLQQRQQVTAHYLRPALAGCKLFCLAWGQEAPCRNCSSRLRPLSPHAHTSPAPARRTGQRSSSIPAGRSRCRRKTACSSCLARWPASPWTIAPATCGSC